MKKRILLALGWLFCLPALWAQSPVTEVTYSTNQNRELTDLMDILGAMQLNIELRGSFARKQAELVCFTVQGDKTDSVRVSFMRPLPTDSLSLKVLSYQFSPDSVRLAVMVDGLFKWTPTVAVRKTNHILLETSLDSLPANDIPLLAYSTGLPIQMQLDGKTVTGASYCGLRDKQLHPAQWYEQLGLSDYAYLVLRFPE